MQAVVDADVELVQLREEEKNLVRGKPTTNDGVISFDCDYENVSVTLHNQIFLVCYGN